MEQTCACFLAQTCVCRYYHELSRLENDSNVRDVLAQCLRARACDGRGDAQVQNVLIHDAGMLHPSLGHLDEKHYLQLIQIPLIILGRLPSIKRNRLMGNVVFWLGLYAGFPLLCVAYVAY